VRWIVALTHYSPPSARCRQSPQLSSEAAQWLLLSQHGSGLGLGSLPHALQGDEWDLRIEPQLDLLVTLGTWLSLAGFWKQPTDSSLLYVIVVVNPQDSLQEGLSLRNGHVSPKIPSGE
jgi:hypothetical protein